MTNVAKAWSVKMEETEEDDLCITSIKIDKGAEMTTLPLKVVLDLVLLSRSRAYVDTLLEKLKKQGIDAPRLLKQLSRKGIETALGSNQSFSLGEVSDVLGVRDAIWTSCRNNDRPKGGKKGYGKGKRRYQHRSRSRSGERRQHNSGNQGNDRERLPEQDTRPPPALWKATEEGDLDSCRRLLEDQSIDVDEPYKFRTALMKAAEAGNVEIAQLLLERGADIKSTASSLHGRDPLSLAAAPSMKKASTDGHQYVLRLLVERGADPLRKDELGQTAKERAKREGLDDIVKCLEELECGIGEFWID